MIPRISLALPRLKDAACSRAKKLRAPTNTGARTGCHDCLLQHTFLHRRRVVTVFLAEVQPVDAPPDRFLFTLDRPSASAVRSSALATDQQFCQSIFTGVPALLGFGTFLLNFPFASTPCQFFLCPTKGGGGDDCRMIVLHKVHGPGLAVVAPYLFTDAVHYIGLVEYSVPCVLFIC